MVNWIPLFILMGIFILPILTLILGLFLLLRTKRQTKAFVRISDKEFEIKNCQIYGKKLKTKVNGKSASWVVSTKPNSLRTALGLIPFYLCEVGKAVTSEMIDAKQTTITEKELALIEEQAILGSLLKSGVLGKEGIMIIIGALGVGAVLGIILGKMVLFKSV